MNTMENVIFDINHIYKIYGEMNGEPIIAVNDVSLKISKGDFLSIMGRSGSGKSTLINCISTIDRPSKGNIIINGKNVLDMHDDEISEFRRDKLGFIFQNYNLLESLTIFENICLPLSFNYEKGTGKDIKKNMIENIAEELYIRNILNKYPSECSGGQRQRTAIARALVSNPSILIADEPTGNLDSKNSKELMNVLQRLNKENGITVIVVTHDPLIASYSSRMLYIEDGKIKNTINRNEKNQKEFYNTIMKFNEQQEI